MPQEVESRQALHQKSCRIILIQPFDKIIPTESLYNNPPCLPVAQLIQSHFLTGAPNLQIIVYISKGGSCPHVNLAHRSRVAFKFNQQGKWNRCCSRLPLRQLVVSP